MGFKEDADFARFLSMGAIGTAAVADNLQRDLGHAPVELERYALSNKVWQTKVKRLRLPDLVCARCGVRVESRAKSKLSMVLSHSDAPGREWDGGGMRDRDLFAFLRVQIGSDSPVAGMPVYVETDALRRSIGAASRSAPKAASQGSEVTLTWPCWIPAKNGTVVGLDDNDRILCHWDDGKRFRYWQWRNWERPRYLYVEPGDRVVAGESIVAGVVEEPSNLVCPGETWDFVSSMREPDVTERYAAVKVAGLLARRELLDSIITLTQDGDWRVRLEALASLARLIPHRWTDRIAEVAVEPSGDQEQQIEAVFVLSEISSTEAISALALIAGNQDLPSEIRAAGVWGLGQGATPAPRLLLPFISDDDRLVALHAVTALEQISDSAASHLSLQLNEGDSLAASAAMVLQRLHRVDELMDAYERGGPGRAWAVRALGDLPPTEVRDKAGPRLTNALESLLEPNWVAQNDWLRSDDGKAGLDSLDVQKIRGYAN